MAVRTWGMRLSLAALLAGALAVFHVEDASARGSRRQTAGYQEVSLATMRANPRAFSEKQVCFDAFFAGLGRIYQPFQTPFVSDQFLNFHVWERETHLWDNKDRKNAYLFCYVPRDLDKQASDVMGAKMYDAIRIYGRIVVVYAGQPWFEIEDIEPSDVKSFSDLALKHILVGMKSLKTEDFPMARESFDEARREGLPAMAQAFVQRQLGHTYYELESYAKAYEEFRTAGEEDAWLALRKGQSRSRAADSENRENARQKMLKQALEHLKKARQLEPANPEAHAEIGWVHAKLGEPAKGILDCKRALSLSQSASTHRILAKIYIMIDKFAHAENNYQRAIMLDPSNPRHHQELADLYMAQGEFAKAEDEYNNVITLTRTEPDGHLMLAEALKRQGRTNEVVEAYEAARSRAPENIDALLGLAKTYADSDPADFKRARYWVGQAKRLARNDVRVRVTEAELLFAQGAFEDAIAACNEIVGDREVKGDLASAYHVLGVAIYRAKKPDLGLAAKKLEMAAKLNEDQVETRKVLAEVYADRGDYTSAVKHLLKARELERGDERIRLMLADALAENNQVQEALKELADLANERPESAYARNNRAALLLEFGREADWQEARDLAQEAFEKDRSNADFLDTLGWAKYKLGDPDDGRLHIELSIMKSKRPEPFYHLAVIAADSSQPTIAKEKAEEAIRRVGEIPGKGLVGRKLEQDILAVARKVNANLNPSPREE
jgi:tetratricopeptide (TPR) repeat protein